MAARGRLAALLIATMLILLCAHAPAQAEEPDSNGNLERKVKAVYLLNFTRYIEWPPGTFQSSHDPISICILGEDPFGDMLDRAAAGQSVRYRHLEVKRLSSPALDGTCHLAFLGKKEEGQLSGWLAALKNHPTLLVTDSPKIFGHGGHILLYRHEDTIRFSVNLAASRQAGFVISSRMLALAQDVISELASPGRPYA